MEEFRGILFTLKKRVQSIAENDSDFYKYLVLGHYDGFDIHLIKKWYDFRPKGLKDRQLQVDLKLPYIDQYTVRAMIPNNRDSLDQKGFAYSFWEDIAGRTCMDMDGNGASGYPYFSMSVINLSKDYVKSRKRLSDLQEGIEKIIMEGAQAVGYLLSDLHCGIFPSIGYSDFVILFQVDDLKKASDIISFIRGSSEKHVGAVVSNCYSVCGVDKRFMNSDSLKGMRSVQISIRINLKGGISSNGFLKIMEEEIDRQLTKYPSLSELEELKKELPGCYFVAFGNADCIILPEQPLERYLKLHAEGGIFHPVNEFFQKYIVDIRTSVRIQGQENGRSSDRQNLSSRSLEMRKIKFQKFIERYDDFLEANHMHIRSSRAMNQIMKDYLNIAQTSHGFDMECVIGRAFYFLLEAMDIYIQEKTFPDEDKDKNKKKAEAVNALGIFKEYVGTFIADLGRSDRPFIEGNTLTHPSIGSATKLLFAYSHILKEVLERYDDKGKFHFVVISGGCDRTKTIDLFSFADSRENVNKPILLCIPEMSLYDIQGTLFRMLHECMHFLGKRRRKERSRHIIRALARETAWDISDLKFNPNLLEKGQRHAFLGLSDEDKQWLERAMVKEFNRLRRKAQEKISQLIQDQIKFKEYLEETDEHAFYSCELKKRMLDPDALSQIWGIRKTDSETGKQMQDHIHDIFLNLEEEWYIFVEEKLVSLYNGHIKKGEKLEAVRVRLPLQAFSMKTQEFGLFRKYPEKKEICTEQFIRNYMDNFMGNAFVSDESFLTTLKYQEILEVIMTAMAESFSDCSAIRILDMPPEDFILSFIYELWDVERAFPLVSDNILRMGADLKVIYGIENSLGEPLRVLVREKAKRRQEQGYGYRNIEVMLNRLDKILSEYHTKKYQALREEVEEYLKICTPADQWYFDKLGELYKKCEFKTSEEIYEVIDGLISRWMSL